MQQEERRTAAAPDSLKALRRVTKNTLELQAMALNDMTLYRVNQIIVGVLEPYMQSHSEQCKTCRSPAETRKWVVHEFGEGWLDLTHNMVGRLQDEDALSGMGFDLSVLVDGGKPTPGHPAIVAQDELANSMASLSVNLLREMVISGFSNSHLYPRGFFALLDDDLAPGVMREMASYHELFEGRVRGSRTPFWKRAWRRSYFEDPFCAEALDSSSSRGSSVGAVLSCAHKGVKFPRQWRAT